MNSTQKFSLELAELCREKWFSPPEDPLEELSHSEIQLRRFCFENNQKVIMEIGDQKQDLFLDPDIILILKELPQVIFRLDRNENIEISFPESEMTLYFQPVDNSKLKCIWRSYGESIAAEEFSLDKYQFIKVLKVFLDKILTKAVQLDYITLTEKNEFLLPSCQPINN
ncbi:MULTISPECIES: hypothetical protein [Calothrix]|uniref:Uncharacterized protein n=2 Tax=Calothrix TaxID=1186 RepID=A0ABR8AIT9_9CYAN|nr:MULTISPECIES: hypothetical protein [Calothrix]MBD2199193.1 hypothetical protein [Calothrix parietina FACHB-288]MBD2227895.1 hypothetical protein [Calothrix anomala FACHB-343]